MTKQNNHYRLIVILCLFLTGCISPSSNLSNVDTIPNVSKTLSATSNYGTFTLVQGSPFYIYASKSNWVKVYSFSGANQKYKIMIAPTTVSAPISASPPISAQGISSNNVLNLCYIYTTPGYSYDLPTLTNFCGTPQNNPIANTTDCFAPTIDLDQHIYPYGGANLYLALFTNSSSNIIANPCFRYEESQCQSRLATSFVFPGNLRMPSTTSCIAAYDANGLASNFANSQCVFYDGMGFTIGYNNIIGNLFNGQTSFYSNIDPNSIIFQSLQEVDNLPSCSAEESCAINFSLIGGASYPQFSGTNPLGPFVPPSSRTYSGGYGANKNYLEASGYGKYPSLLLNYEMSGCYAIGGVPFFSTDIQNNNGRLEYLFADSTPNNNTPATGYITGADDPGPFLNMVGRSPAGGQDLYLRIHDSGSRTDNYGFYEVQVYAVSEPPPNFVGQLINNIITPIQMQISTVSNQIFSQMSGNSTFLNIINAMLVLYITFFGISFLIGNTNITQKDLVIRACKIAICLVFLNQDTAIYFFNDYLLNLFWNGITDLIAYTTNTSFTIAKSGQHQLNYNELFSFVTTFFSPSFFSVLFILLLWIPVGWLIIILLIKGIVIYFNALLIAVISYLIALTAIGLFIALGPIFIILILFDQTREIFDNWIKVMTSFVFQPVIMFAAIFLINKIMAVTLEEILDLNVGLEQKASISIPFGGSVKITIAYLYLWVPNMEIISVGVAAVMFNIFCEMLQQAPGFASNIARNLFASGAGDSAGEVGSVASGIVDSAKKPIGLDKDTQQQFARDDSQQQASDKNADAEADLKNDGEKKSRPGA